MSQAKHTSKKDAHTEAAAVEAADEDSAEAAAVATADETDAAAEALVAAETVEAAATDAVAAVTDQDTKVSKVLNGSRKSFFLFLYLFLETQNLLD